MVDDPTAFHGKECCDPVEGMDYQTRNCGFILHQGGRVEIYSRAHGDRYAYFLPLSDEEDVSESLKGLNGNTGSNHGGSAGSNPGGNSGALAAVLAVAAAVVTQAAVRPGSLARINPS